MSMISSRTGQVFGGHHTPDELHYHNNVNCPIGQALAQQAVSGTGGKELP